MEDISGKTIEIGQSVVVIIKGRLVPAIVTGFSDELIGSIELQTEARPNRPAAKINRWPEDISVVEKSYDDNWDYISPQPKIVKTIMANVVHKKLQPMAHEFEPEWYDLTIERLQRDCAEAYQAVGVLAEDNITPGVEKLLDNLLAASQDLPRPHDDLLPFLG